MQDGEKFNRVARCKAAVLLVKYGAFTQKKLNKYIEELIKNKKVLKSKQSLRLYWRLYRRKYLRELNKVERRKAMGLPHPHVIRVKIEL